MKRAILSISIAAVSICVVLTMALSVEKGADKATGKLESGAAPQPAAAAGDKTAQPEQKKAGPPKERSKEELVKLLNEKAQNNPDLQTAVQELVIKEDGGKKFLEFKGKKLEDLDKETLNKLYVAVSRYLTIRNTQRIEKQLRSIRQIEDLNRAQRITTVPAIPVTPTMPQQPPRTQPPPRPPVPTSTYRAPGK